jgi:hypothetical protein
MRRATLLLVAILSAAVAAAAEPVLFTLTDPRGDDHGDGRIVYPLDEELNPGDLDLLSLTARAETGGTRFEATFAKPVRVPAREPIDQLGTQLSTIARFGFYTLNLDIYIDMDRKEGSGGVAMLPGRKAEIDPAHAWDRAILLTPRPFEAKEELKRTLLRNLKDDESLDTAEAEALKLQVPGDVENRIFFPTQVKVRGNRISFFVPDSFLGGPAKATWSYVVAVSGADLLQSIDVRRLMGRDPSPDSLMILPVSPGRWSDRFGGGRDDSPIQPPLLDVIVPEGVKQETVLADFDARSGKRVVLVGVVPGE